MKEEFFRTHLMYIHHQETSQANPHPSLHKDIDLGVPTSPLRFY